MSNQILRSGTSIGANVAEAIYAASKADFINKLHIAVKEARETQYWLEILRETDYITKVEFDSLHQDCIELVKLLSATLNSSKKIVNS